MNILHTDDKINDNLLTYLLHNVVCVNVVVLYFFLLIFFCCGNVVYGDNFTRSHYFGYMLIDTMVLE